jgi:hypothetical protein
MKSQRSRRNIKRIKKQNTTPVEQLVEIIKESLALMKRQYEEKKTHQVGIKPASVLETLDDTDLICFFKHVKNYEAVAKIGAIPNQTSIE